MPQYDPLTVQRMLEMLPEIEKRKRKSKKARDEQAKYEQMMNGRAGPNHTPTMNGGMYQTVAQWRPDRSQIGNQVVGAVGSYLSGRTADREEEELTNMQQGQSLQALEQYGSDTEGGATDNALRGYLGMLGGDGSDAVKGLNKAPHVSSTKILQDGSVVNIMSDGTHINTGMKGDYSSQMVQDPATGNWSAIGKSGAGRGVAAPVTAGESSAPSGPPAPAAPAPQTGDAFEKETIELANDMAAANIPEEQINAFIQKRMAKPRHQTGDNGQEFMGAGGAVAGYLGTPPPAAGGQFQTATPAQQAAATEQAKIGVQVANAPQTNAAAAQGEQMKLDAKTAAEHRAKIPQMQSNIATMEAVINQMLAPENAAALANITGRTIGGNIPDTSFDVDGKSHIGLARKAWDIANSGKPEAKLMSMHDQLKGQVFMQAFQMLRGGGQITNVEGEKATAAYARMNRSVSTEDYKAALKEFLEATRAGYAKIQAAAGGGYSAGGPGIGAPPAPAAAKPVLPPGFSWE